MQALAVLSLFLFYDLFSLYLINSSDMSLIIGKRCIQKCIHNLQGQPRSYHSSAKCKDIGIIVKSCSLCCKTICADCSSDSFKLVCCNGNSDTWFRRSGFPSHIRRQELHVQPSLHIPDNLRNPDCHIHNLYTRFPFHPDTS